MGTSKPGEVTASRGGLRARLTDVVDRATGFERRAPALVRMFGFATVVIALGVIGHCVGAPAAASTSAPLTMSATSSGGAPPSSPLIVAAADAAAPRLVAPAPILDAGVTNHEDEILELNTATESDLRRLPGIGERRARAIVELRARMGGFKRVDDLVRVRGIGRAAMKRLRPLVKVERPP